MCVLQLRVTQVSHVLCNAYLPLTSDGQWLSVVSSGSFRLLYPISVVTMVAVAVPPQLRMALQPRPLQAGLTMKNLMTTQRLEGPASFEFN